MSCRRLGLSGPVCVWTPLGFYLSGFPSPYANCRREARVLYLAAFAVSIPDFSSNLSPEVFSTKGYFRKTVVFEIRVFYLLGEPPKSIELHLPVCHLCRWQFGPNKWSSPTTKSLDSIVITSLLVGHQLGSL